MDNYLGYRWPGQNGAPAAAPVKKNRRRGWRVLLGVILALAVIGGLLAGGYYGGQYLAARWMDQLPDLPAITPTRSPWGEEEWTAELLPSGDPDPEGEIVLMPRAEAQELDAGRIYQTVLPSVVCVQATNGRGYSVGSGVVITGDGYVITNYHIMEECTTVSVMRLDTYEVFAAGLVGFDEELDLAVLKAEGAGFVPAVLGDSDELKVGDPVYAIGNPMGYLYGAMTDGIVSAVVERTDKLSYPGRLIQTTAALNSGNSGGALVDAYGRVVGITSAKITGVRDDVVTEGLGLAIPLTDVHGYLTRILRTGGTARAALGIICAARTVDGVSGIQVFEVTEGTHAVGVLKEDDLIITADGVRVTELEELLRELSWKQPGEWMELTVLRHGEEITVSVELYDRLKEGQDDQ